jgi:hypothetical protein
MEHSMKWKLKYVDYDPELSSSNVFDTLDDVFLEVAECIAGAFGDCEMDFDCPTVKGIVEALQGSDAKQLIEAVNEYYQKHCGGEHFDLYEITEPKTEPEVLSRDERMQAVLRSVEKARTAWLEWKNEDKDEAIH